ncbi:MAG: response regulator transcription factor [Pedobacter sp.]|nr:response regulator transcription factor [Pedobacter sp.]
MKSRKLKILIIEDETILRENIVDFLELKNFKTYQAKNGLDALEILHKDVPDIIISDIAMPVFNGIQLLKIIRKNDKYNHIPFIFLTAKAEKDDLRDGMLNGADDYIIKPFTFDVLYNSINTRINRLKQLQEFKQNDFSLSKSVTLYSEKEQTALSLLPTLSRSENTILKKIGQGMTSLEIANKLNISVRTVDNHRYNICKKLKLSGTNSLIKFILKVES